MKVLLINPFVTFHPGAGAERIAEPLGLLYIAAMCEKYGNEVKVLDMFRYGVQNVQVLPDHKMRIGLDLSELTNIVNNFRPDVVGLSSMFGAYQNDCLVISREIKKISEEIRVIWGGANATANAEELMQQECIDYIVVGEGEYAFIHILENLDSEKVDFPSVSYKRNGKALVNTQKQRIEKLDELPFPARHLLRWNNLGFKELYAEGRVWTKKRRVAAIATSRGCPFDCVFCASRKMWGRVWKGRSPENVFAEIKHLYDEYDIREFHFYDDNASLSKERLRQLCHLIQSEGLNISLAAPNGLFIGSLDEELLTALASAGFYRITLPIETGCPKTHRSIGGKPIDLNHVKKIVAICNKLGIWTHANFIIGFPEETREDIEETIQYACALDIDSCVFFIAQPLPHTKLTEDFRQIGSLQEAEFIQESSFYNSKYNTRYFTWAEMNKLREEASKRFRQARLFRMLLKPKYTLSIIKKLATNGLFMINILINKFLYRRLFKRIVKE